MGGTVKDLLVLLSISIIIIGGFIGIRTFPPSTVSKQKIKTSGVSKYESSNHRRYEQKRASQSRSRITREAPKSDQLPDLYEAEEQSERLSVEEGDADLLTSSETSSEGPVVLGVPVGDWVRSNQNKLRDAQVSAPTRQGLRLFLGCLEIKEGPTSFEKHTCEKLLTNKDSKLPGERERY